MKRLRAAAIGAIVALLAAKAGVAQPAKLYAFATHLSGPLQFADHTWATDYSAVPKCPSPAAHYWYATGACHPSTGDAPRLLASADADLQVATCIATPNMRTSKPGPATARVLYGFDGVCHQIVNRILAATGTHGKAAITVAGAQGYKISRFVYGEYGTPQQWNTLRADCKLPGIHDLTMQSDLSAMVAQAGLEPNLRIILNEQERLRGQISEIRLQATSKTATSVNVAERLNSAINESLGRLRESLGADGFQRLFDWPPGERIVLVNPEVAAQIDYSMR